MQGEIKRINLRDNHFFISYNNWETFEYHDSGNIEGVPETNLDIISEVKIRYMLGDYYGFYIINELKEIQEQYQLNKNEGYGEAFEIFTMATLLHDDNYDNVFDNYIVNGSFDGGIDAAVFDDHSVTLYQIKTDYAQDFSQIKEKMEKNYNKYLDNRELRDSNLSDLNTFFKKHDRQIRDGLEFSTITVCSNRGSDYKPLDIFNKYIKNCFLNRTNNMEIELRADSNSKVAKIGDTNQAYAFFVNAKKFIDNLLENKIINNDVNNLNKLFYDNVRGQLKDNSEMENTILHDSKNFVLYNNGITITGGIKYIQRTNSFVISEPIISNGQQTLWNLVKYIDSEQLSNINLLIYIKNTSNSSKIKNNISRYTNTQTKIKPIDLLSLNYHIRDIQEKIAYEVVDNTKFFLDINTSGNRGYENKMLKIFNKDNIIKISDFCKLYYSTEDKNVGSWKNNISTKIKEKMEAVTPFDLDKSISICKIISEFNNTLKNTKSKEEQNILSTASLALMYISYVYNKSISDSKNVIDKINKKFFYDLDPKKRPSKLIDIYKVDSIVTKIEEVISS